MDVQLLEESGLHKAAAETYHGTFSSCDVSSFLAKQVHNRDSASWKKATHIIIDPPAHETDRNRVLDGWFKLVDADPTEEHLQCLYFTTDGVVYDLYDGDKYKRCSGSFEHVIRNGLALVEKEHKAFHVYRLYERWQAHQPATRGAAGLFDPQMARSYRKALRSKLKEDFFATIPIKNVFEVVNCDDYKRLEMLIRGLEGFKDYNDNYRNGLFSAALSQYGKFLSELEIQETLRRDKMNWQKIVYGAPGTGKSFGSDIEWSDDHGNPKATVFRTTFHPDSDYSTFVGAYKPTSIKVPRIALDGTTVKKAGFGTDITADQKKLLEQEDHITYSFRPQAFMNAYVAAWKDITKSVVLIIEEINRGNCAQIFGDLFQLLDRDDRTGYSTYPITADTDLKKWLAEDGQFGPTGLAGIAKPDSIKQPDWDGIIKGEMLALPPNLYIWATMNTSDQSLFPIDSAFKRRWDWKYVPIRKGKFKKGPKKGQEMAWKIKVTVPAHQEGEQPVGAKDYTYDWWDFLKCVNTLIFKTTDSEDKKLGYFFVKPDGKSDPAADDNDLISADRFVGKVIFYLWNDVFKDYGIETIFKAHEAGKKSEDGAKGVEFQAFFNESDDEVNVTTLLAFFKQLELKSDEEKAAAGRAQNNQGAAQNNQGTAQNNQGAEQNNPPAQDGGDNPEA